MNLVPRVSGRNMNHWMLKPASPSMGGAGLLKAEKGFDRIKGYRSPPLLAAALERELPQNYPTRKQPKNGEKGHH